jgi:hypothetical protein
MLDKPATAKASVLNKDMSKAPMGEPILALTLGGILVREVLTARNIKYYTQWAKFPERDKSDET